MKSLRGLFTLTVILSSMLFGARGFAEEMPSIDVKNGGMSAEDRACYEKWHSRFGYLTLALAAGAVGTHREKQEAKEEHEIYGMATAVSLLASSYFGWKAGHDTSKPDSRSKKAHRILGYVTLPLMILLPLSGMDANDAYKEGRDPDGLGKMKGALTGLTVASLVATAAVIHFEF